MLGQRRRQRANIRAALVRLGGLSALLTRSAELAILPTCYSTDLCFSAIYLIHYFCVLGAAGSSS